MAKVIYSFFLSLILLLSFGFKNEEPKKSMLGKEINNFTLKNINRRFVSLNDYKNAKGFAIMFTCNHCPFAKLYSKRMNQLNKKYAALGVPLLAINSMDTLLYEEETFDQMQLKAKNNQFNFPYLFDETQNVGKQFNAEHTPQVFVVWKENNKWVIKYAGAFDDNGEHPEKAKHYVANAIDDLLKNKPVKNPETQSFGCRIYYRK
jgi:peroxiredoxin